MKAWQLDYSPPLLRVHEGMTFEITRLVCEVIIVPADRRAAERAAGLGRSRGRDGGFGDVGRVPPVAPDERASVHQEDAGAVRR